MGNQTTTPVVKSHKLPKNLPKPKLGHAHSAPMPALTETTPNNQEWANYHRLHRNANKNNNNNNKNNNNNNSNNGADADSDDTKQSQTGHMLSIAAAALQQLSPRNSCSLETKQSEINVFENLKAECADSILVLAEFWSGTVLQLSADEYFQLAMLFYANVFSRIKDARELFINSKIQMETQAKIFFGMFGWLVTVLVSENPEKTMKRIRKLGLLHQKMHIKAEYYEQMLIAFHETMTEEFKSKYSLRVRFCFAQLYEIVSEIMQGIDFLARCQSLHRQDSGLNALCLSSLEACLADPNSRAYLELYMKQQFCSELISFYEDYKAFKSCLEKKERGLCGQRLRTLYMTDKSERALSVPCAVKAKFHADLAANNNTFVEGIYDACLEEVLSSMRCIFANFKQEMVLLNKSRGRTQSSNNRKQLKNSNTNVAAGNGLQFLAEMGPH